jgi:hypothetical protein
VRVTSDGTRIGAGSTSDTARSSDGLRDRAPRWRAPGGSLGAALSSLRSDGAPARQAPGGEVVQHPRRREDDEDGRAN